MGDADFNALAPHVQNHLRLAQSPPSGSDRASSERSEGSSSRFNLASWGIGSSRNKDGDKPKRRGPKPDSKPALTRRQELNRQAQRTHRERKERYVKTIEEEVARLREAFAIITREKTEAVDENRRLKAILEAHGIPYAFPNASGMAQQQRQDSFNQSPEVTRLGSTYNQIGIEFVLALEKPCMEHIQLLTTSAATKDESDFHGHALMASCPPESHVLHHADVDWGSKTIDLGASDLAVLFNLSNRLELDGELTPIAAWAHVTRHPRFAEFELSDFKSLEEDLLPKTSCHGFGAVVEEYEVHDAIERMVKRRFGSTTVGGVGERAFLDF